MLKTDSLFILSRFYQQCGNLMGNSVFREYALENTDFSEANIYRLCRIGGGERLRPPHSTGMSPMRGVPSSVTISM